MKAGGSKFQRTLVTKIGEIPRVVLMKTSNPTTHRIQGHLPFWLVSITAVNEGEALKAMDSFHALDSPYPALSGSADKP